MPNTCWSLSHCCSQPWAELFHAHLHSCFLLGNLHSFCSFSIQSWTLLLHLGLDIKLVWMKASGATDNSLFPSCRHSVGAFPSPVKCLGAHQYSGLLQHRTAAFPGLVQVFIAWLDKGLWGECPDISASLRILPAWEGVPGLCWIRHRSLTVPQMPCTVKSRIWPEGSLASDSLSWKVSFNTWAKTLKGIKITMS